ISPEALTAMSLRLADHRFVPASYDYAGTPPYTGEDWGRFVLLGVSVVWRLWPPEGHRMWGVPTAGGVVEDAPGVWMCFGREPRSLDLEWLAGGGHDEGFFAGDGHLQDVPLRVRRLQEVGAALLERHDGSVLDLIARCDGDAVMLRDSIVDTLPGY